jgi:glutathione S-transferase
MYKLYERPGAGNTVVEAVLAEAGQTCELIRVPRNDDTTIPEWFYAVNPRGEVPALVLPNGQLMTESAAIIIYLADIFPEAGLAPTVTDPTRARYLQWIHYFATNAYSAALRSGYPQNFSDDPQSRTSIEARANADLERINANFSAALGDDPYILGETFSAADIYAAMLSTWVPDVHANFARHANIKRLYERVAHRPKIKPVFERNEILV